MNLTYIYIYIYIYIYRERERERERDGSPGVIAFVIKNGHSKPSSNPSQGCLYFT